jgi:hypothetical protein
MNKLHELLNDNPNQTKDAFEKAFKKVFGFTPEIEGDDNGIIFTSHEEKFSLDFEGTLLWYRHKGWFRITSLEEARQLWQN